MLGLDTYDPAPKPHRMFSRYEVSSALHRNRVGYNLMFDREMSRVNTNRNSLKTFLHDQQKWLSNLKSDLNTSQQRTTRGGTTAVYNNLVGGGGGHISQDHSLIGLRNNLSELIR